MHRVERDQREIPGRPRLVEIAFQAFWALGRVRTRVREAEADEVDWRDASACGGMQV